MSFVVYFVFCLVFFVVEASNIKLKCQEPKPFQTAEFAVHRYFETSPFLAGSGSYDIRRISATGVMVF